MLTYLVLGMTFAFAAAVQPGPLQAYLVAQALSHGWRRTLPAALSPLVSDGPIIALVLFVLSRLPAWLIPALRGAGGVLLLVLAVAAARTWRRPDAGAVREGSRPRSLWGATLVNLLNPGPYLGWSLVMGPLLLKGWHEAPARGIALLAGFYGMMVLSLAATIVLFAAARGLGPRVNRTLIGASALALAALGVYQLWTFAAAYRPA